MFQEWLKKYEKLREENNMSEEEKKAIEIVKQFNKENRYRDCGRINNAIDTVIRLAEKLEQEKEKNKELFEEYNKRVATIIKYEQEIKEIIDKIDAEDYYCLNEAEEDLRKLVE